MTRTQIKTWAVAIAAIAVAGCTGPTGPAGAQGDPGQPGDQGQKGDPGTAAPTTGTLAGVVTDAVKKDPLAGVAITVKDSGGTLLGNAITDNDGKFSVTAPAGGVIVNFAKQYWTSPGDLPVGVLAGKSVSINTTLAEDKSGKPSVSLAVTGDDFGYGQSTNLTATASSPTGATLSYSWKNATVPAIGTVTGNGNGATVVLPTMGAAMARRLEDPNKPNQYISGYQIMDRFGVLPIINDVRGTMSISLTVADDRGQSSSASASINATSIQTGTDNVPLGTRVYMNSGHDGPSAWTLTAPQGSTAVLDDATVRTPSFVPDMKGRYLLTEGNNTMTVFGGSWLGAITGGTGDTVSVDSNCTVCHDDHVAPNKFSPWMQTRHATKFARGIDGKESASYGASCIGCHTVGFDKGADNNGFDDVMSKDNWSMPNLVPTAWEDMVKNTPELARLANIQCENCHGPQNSLGHINGGNPAITPWVTLYTNPRVDFSAEVCGTCHAAGSGHHFYSEWNTTDPKTGWGHSNRNTIKLGSSATALNNHCGRCHTAQGYAQYTDQLSKGNPGNLAITSGVTLANAEPVTCTACHEPHDATNPNQLRWYGDSPLLPAGFKAYGLGKGALCITCHNSRNGTYVVNNVTSTYLHEDTETYNSGNPTGYSAPHQACQGDVFAGRNAYFLGGTTPMTSRHSAIEDTCVGCHMAKNPETHTSHGSPAVSSHAFRITDENKGELCANCHGEGVNGEGFQGSIEASLAALNAKMGAALIAKLKLLPNSQVNLVAYDSATDLYSIAPGAAKNPNNLQPLVVDVSQNPIVSASVEEIHGQIGFLLTFTNPVSVQLVDANGVPSGQPKDMTSFGVQMGSIKDTQLKPAAVYALNGNMVRAGWNYFLIEGDQSKGLHNPTFATTVMDNSLAKDLSN